MKGEGQVSDSGDLAFARDTWGRAPQRAGARAAAAGSPVSAVTSLLSPDVGLLQLAVAEHASPRTTRRRPARRLGVSSRPQTSEQVLAIVERDTSAKVAAIVRAVVAPERRKVSASG